MGRMSVVVVLAALLGGVGCGSSGGGGSEAGGSSGSGASSNGAVGMTGGSGSGQCSGACPTPGDTCWIDPPGGSDAPSIRCECTNALEWCCREPSCFDATGGTGGSGGSGAGGSGGASGACARDCESDGLVCCNGRCVNTRNDILNCGECGVVCGGPYPHCGFGSCTDPPCSGTNCSDGQCCGSQCCGSGQLCCNVNIGPSITECTDPVDGTCPVGCPLCICASADTMIATPTGDVPIGSIQKGDVVYSVDDNATVAVPVLATNRVPSPNHVMVEARLAGGAIVRMSPRHPTADGRLFKELRIGDRLGPVRVEAVRIVPYDHAFTYDILPASESGAYFVGGALVGSTLHR